MNRCPVGQVEVEATGRFRTSFLCRVPSHHAVDDVMSPEYFGLLIGAHDFQELDLIEVEWEDGTKWGLLKICAVEKTLQLVTTRARLPIVEEGDVSDLPDGWEMVFRGGTAGWCLLSQGEQVEGGLPTPERARNRIMFLATRDSQRDAVRNVARNTPAKAAKSAKPATETEKVA